MVLVLPTLRALQVHHAHGSLLCWRHIRGVRMLLEKLRRRDLLHKRLLNWSFLTFNLGIIFDWVLK